jgi:uncharacterized protein GlcG (DUF336 family)
MILRKSLTLADAKEIAAAAELTAMSNNLRVCIAIVDDGGHLLHFQRLEGAPLLSISIAIGKARAAAYSRRTSKDLEDIVRSGRTAFLSITASEDIALLEGGEPILVDGVCVGAIGASGARPDDDTKVARAGISGLRVD